MNSKSKNKNWSQIWMNQGKIIVLIMIIELFECLVLISEIDNMYMCM